MPRLQSGVWRHFTPAIKDGRETYMCSYCSKTYTKNATKMQMHLDKCKEYSAFLQQSPGHNGSSSASIPAPSFSFRSSAAPPGQFLFDSVDQRSQALADECLARAVYATASPLALTENVYWRRFFSVLRPAYCPPAGEALRSHLLDCEYQRAQGRLHEAIGKADCVTVVCSGWSDVEQTGAVVYAVATPAPLFYKCTHVEKRACSGAFIAEELKGVINEVGPQKVFAVVTDDAPEMAAAWAQVREAFPHISAFGCAARSVQRLFDDVSAQPSVRSLCRRAEQVLRYVRDRKQLPETFNPWQTTKTKNQAWKETAPTLPSGSDWTGPVDMLSSVLEGQSALQEMAASPALDVEESVAAILQDAAFWADLSSTRNLLYLIGHYVDFMKGEEAALSSVVDMFIRLRFVLEASLHGGERDAVLASLERCREFCVQPVHTAAYMLDPKHAGRQALSGEQINGAYYVISSLAQHLDLDGGKVLASFARFSAKEGLWKGAGIWSSCQHVNPSTWWKGLCSSEPLSAVAFSILQIPPAAAACRRLWSLLRETEAQGDLSPENVPKLVALQTNLKLLEPGDGEYPPPNSEDERKVLFQSETQ